MRELQAQSMIDPVQVLDAVLEEVPIMRDLQAQSMIDPVQVLDLN